MEYQNGNENYNLNLQNQPPMNTDQTTNGMAVAALILGILSILLTCSVFGSFVVGAIAIILAVLSKGYDKKLSPKSIWGVILSIIGMVLSTIMLVVYIILIVSTTFGSEEFNSIMENYDYYNDGTYEYFDNYPDEYYDVYPDEYYDDYNNDYYDDYQNPDQSPDTL